MQTNQQYFILRQLETLCRRGEEPAVALKNVVSQTLDQEISERALTAYRHSGGLLSALAEINVIDAGDKAVANYIKKEKRAHHLYLPAITERIQLAETMVILIKNRLLERLTYSSVLLVIASFVIAILSFKVLPQFQDMYDSMHIELPELTKTIISIGQYHLFPLIGLLLIFFTLLFTFKIKKLPPKVSALKIFKFIPFLNTIYNRCQQLLTLQTIKATLSLEEKLAPESLANNGDLTQDIFENIRIATGLSTQKEEVIYQFEQLKNQTEQYVNEACTRFESALTIAIAVIVGLVIVASYLPIFHFGSAI